MRYDHIIIGAGVIGCSTAYYLKRNLPDSSILLLDRNNRPGAGTTAKSAALYRNIFSSPTSHQLASSSIAYYQELGDEIHMNPIGYLWTFSKEQWDRSRTAKESLAPEEDEIEMLDREDIGNFIHMDRDAGERFPDVFAGILGRRCGSLSGMALAEHYAGLFRELGGEVCFNTGILEVMLSGKGSGYAPWDRVEATGVRSAEGTTYHADNIIAAAGAWTHDLLAPLGIASGVLPKKRQLFGLKLRDPHGLTLLQDISKMPAVILPAGGVYIKPVLEKDIIMVGCAEELGQPYSMDNPDPDVDYFMRAIAPVLSHYFPDLGDYMITTKWAGYYAYHWPDKNPVVESVRNITWVSGTSGSGIMKADAIGRIAAGKLTGEKTVELADGSRFPVSRISLRERMVENERFII